MKTIEIFLNNPQSESALNMIIPFLGVIVGGLLTFFSNYLLENKKLEKERLLDNKRRIDLTYQEIYLELLKVRDYYYLFVNYGNEFKESEDYENFSPLNIITNFLNFIKERELFLDKEFLNEFNKIEKTIMQHPSMALQLAINPNMFDINMIESVAKNTIEEINKFIIFLKKRFQEKV